MTTFDELLVDDEVTNKFVQIGINDSILIDDSISKAFLKRIETSYYN